MRKLCTYYFWKRRLIPDAVQMKRGVLYRSFNLRMGRVSRKGFIFTEHAAYRICFKTRLNFLTVLFLLVREETYRSVRNITLVIFRSIFQMNCSDVSYNSVEDYRSFCYKRQGSFLKSISDYGAIKSLPNSRSKLIVKTYFNSIRFWVFFTINPFKYLTFV